jgi:hypothetical protein
VQQVAVNNRSKASSYSMTSSGRASTVAGTSEAERVRRFAIDHELEFRRLLDRKLGWLLAAKDAVDKDAARSP